MPLWTSNLILILILEKILHNLHSLKLLNCGYECYLSLLLVLVKSSDELFGPLDSLWTGGELLLHGLDLPGVDHLFTFTETEKNSYLNDNSRLFASLNTIWILIGTPIFACGWAVCTTSFTLLFLKGSISFILYENNLANSWAERRENIFKYLRNGRNCCSINNKVSLRDRKNSKYFKLNWCLCVYVPAFPKAQRCITWAGTEQRTWPCILLDISCLLSVQSPAVK